jgi:DNA primase catalytic subunit
LRQRLCFPVNNYPPTILQRKHYYSDEFDGEKVKQWLGRLPEPLRNPIFSIDVGTESGLARKNLKSFRGKMLLVSLAEITELKEKLTGYSPEDVYYDRNIYEDKDKCIECKKRGEKDCSKCTNITGQHVMFDVDPENIDCPNCGNLGERMKRKSMYGFCYICFKEAAAKTVELYNILLQKGYENLQVVYSGRGFHVYIEDPESYTWTFEKRNQLAVWAKEEEKLPIDPWVTRGGTRFARLPYSLHGLVGKIVTPIGIGEVPTLNPSREKRLTPASMALEKSESKK